MRNPAASWSCAGFFISCHFQPETETLAPPTQETPTMPAPDLHFDSYLAIDRLLRFLDIPGVTGEEESIGRAVAQVLREAGVPPKNITFDNANKHIPLPTQTGNLIVDLPGTRKGPRRLFMTHLDTVPLCAGCKPLRKGQRIVSAAPTALGGDNRTGVGVLVTLATTLIQRRLEHDPITLLFTVREESGLWGARFVDRSLLGDPVVGFNVDGSSARQVTIGAVGAERWHAEIEGRAAHAGVHPERGVSATLVASLALAEVHKGGWFGKVKQNGKEGTSNVGTVAGRSGGSAGNATNVVTDFVQVHGEARSHDAKFASAITKAYRDAFANAAKRIVDDKGRGAKVRFQTRRDYYPFHLKENSPVVKQALAAGTLAGWEPTLRLTNGGLDANWLVRHKIPTITFGAGQNNVHTTEEFVEIADYLEGCKYALALAQGGSA
jgi:tripeptide aminopeptidase